MSNQSAQTRLNLKKIPVWRLLGSLLSIVLLVYLVLSQGWTAFLEILQRIPTHHFLIAMFLVLLSRCFVTLRWYILLRTAGVSIRFTTSLRLVFMGLFASNFLPSTVGGDLVRLAGAVRLRIDAAISAASLVVDRLVGMAGMAIFLPFGLAAVTQPVHGWKPLQISSLSITAIIKIPGIRGLWNRLVKFLHSLLQSSTYWLKHPAGLGFALLCTFVHQLCTYLIIWILLHGMNHNLSLLTIGGLWSLTYFFSLAPVSINGLGLQEVSVAYLYSTFGGIPMQAGLALALLLRMMFMIISLPGVAFLPDILHPQELIREEKESTG